MKIVTGLSIQGNAIVPTYSNLSITSQGVKISPTQGDTLDDQQQLDLTTLVTTIVSGGGGGFVGVLYTNSQLLQTASTGPVSVTVSTPGLYRVDFYWVNPGAVDSGELDFQILANNQGTNQVGIFGDSSIWPNFSNVDAHGQISSLMYVANGTMDYTVTYTGTGMATPNWYIAIEKLI